MTNKEKQIFLTLRKEARKESQKCYAPNCNNLAIRSHIQQAEGPLRQIASNGKIIQLKFQSPLFHTHSYKFEEEEIKNKMGNVLTFWGFCPQCDTKIFKKIEQKEYNLYDYENQLLHSYRGFLNELNKKEYNLKHCELVLKNDGLSQEIKTAYKDNYINIKLDIAVLKNIQEKYESDAFAKTRNFEFITIKLPKLEICTSAVFSLPLFLRETQELLDKIESNESIKLSISILSVSLIPTQNELYCILGQPLYNNVENRFDLDKISRCSQREQAKIISDILIKHIETWCVSTSLFNLWKRQKKDIEIIQQISRYFPPEMKKEEIEFNLFQDI